jgi:hypothetical protein
MASQMAAALIALHGGRITFQKFERDTRRDWDKIAGKLYRKWSLPVGVGEEDVRQELLLGAWMGVFHPKSGWDPSRGVRIEVHVVWNACSWTKKWIHRQRQARRRDERAPSRHPLTMGALGVDVDGELSVSELVDLFAHVEPDQEANVEHGRFLELVENAAETALARDALRFWILAGGDVVEAGVDLSFDAAARADHGLKNWKQGVRAVERAVTDAIKAASAAEETRS